MAAFLFDIGNVIVRFDFAQAALKLAALSTSTAEEVMTLLSPFKDDLESGRISDEAFVSASMERIGFRGTAAQFIQIWGDIFTENTPMIDLIKHLSGKVPLFLLSNTSGLHKDWLFANFPVFEHFQGGVYSHEAGCAKPHVEIFEQVITLHGLNPATTIYVDDLVDNIKTGQGLGFLSHHYSPDDHQELDVFIRKHSTTLGIESLFSSFPSNPPV